MIVNQPNTTKETKENPAPNRFLDFIVVSNPNKQRMEIKAVVIKNIINEPPYILVCSLLLIFYSLTILLILVAFVETKTYIGSRRGTRSMNFL
jgi:hypothetical protein